MRISRLADALMIQGVNALIHTHVVPGIGVLFECSLLDSKHIQHIGRMYVCKMWDVSAPFYSLIFDNK